MINRSQTAAPLTVWLLTDLKPGHKNQLQGLIDCLQQYISIDAHWVSVIDHPIRLRDWVLGREPVADLPPPQWVIGAGHATHIPLLICGRIYGAKTVVLMGPSLPMAWFNACVIPQHDNPPLKSNVLVTLGVLNTMVPQVEARVQNQGLILIGGVNKHFHWHDSDVAEQVKHICEHQPQVQWTLTNSRRTPDRFWSQIKAMALSNLELVPYSETPSGWVKQKLEQSSQVWVSRDSVSMVFESITAGAATGLLSLPAIKSTRVVKSMEQVLEHGWAQDYNGWDMNTPLPYNSKALWEAQRAAKWLIDRLVVTQ